ncbi:hypothetical protein ACH5RR_013100 [Cinchona calisaya]|uniref:Uncharacterized protein n=1 Tax=Cinchona calisaya TaxID=153742 RepID=A0ABD2ZZK0_9GENT
MEKKLIPTYAKKPITTEIQNNQSAINPKISVEVSKIFVDSNTKQDSPTSHISCSIIDCPKVNRSSGVVAIQLATPPVGTKAICSTGSLPVVTFADSFASILGKFQTCTLVVDSQPKTIGKPINLLLLI